MVIAIMANTKHSGSEVAPVLLRTREAAHVLSVSESQIIKFERQGLLRAVHIPGIRAVRFVREEVERLAAAWTGNNLATRS
jgi:excisionase family DNA binding protein